MTIKKSLLVLGLAACSMTAQAQFRDGQAPVIARDPVAAPPKPPDIAPVFAGVYAAAGRPRILLMWNRELLDKTQTEQVDTHVTRSVGSSSVNALDKSTLGPTGSATIKDSSDTHDQTKTVTLTRGAAADPRRSVTLAERHATQLYRAFVSEMNRGGVQFIDRALVIRTTAAAQHRTGGDAKLIETDALLKSADLLMEVIMVEDKSAPAGYAFDVRAKDLKRGTEITSVYSRALPPDTAQKPGGWVAGQSGYEYKTAPPPPPPSPGQVGAALARDVMFMLGTTLEAANKTAAVPPRGR